MTELIKSLEVFKAYGNSLRKCICQVFLSKARTLSEITRSLKDTQTQLNMYKDQLSLISIRHKHKILGVVVGNRMIQGALVSIVLLVFTILEKQLWF